MKKNHLNNHRITYVGQASAQPALGLVLMAPKLSKGT